MNNSLKIFLFVAIPLISHHAFGFCVQNFNAYGPAYSTELNWRTHYLSRALNTQPACDVVQLQEVWTENHIDLLMNQIDAPYSFLPNREHRVGMMNLAETPIKVVTHQYFTHNTSGSLLDMGRKILGVKKSFTVISTRPSGSLEEIYFLNLHLHPTSQAIRLSQIMDLWRWRKNHLDQKLILSGDFNAGPKSLEIRFLKALLNVESVDPQEKIKCTYCAENPRSWLFHDEIFDGIYFSNIGGSNDLKLKPTSFAVNLKGFSNFTLSDHYGLKAEFSMGHFPETHYGIKTGELTTAQKLILKYNNDNIIKEVISVLNNTDAEQFKTEIQELKY